MFQEIKSMSAANRTRYHLLFEPTLWNKEILAGSNVSDNVIENRNKLVTDYSVERYISESPSLPQNIISFEGIARVFQHCEYYQTKSGYLMTISPSNPVDERDQSWLARKGFQIIYPIRDLDSSTYVLTSSDWMEISQLIVNISTVAQYGLSKALLLMGLSVYKGKILHVTGGSGITTLKAECEGLVSVVDTDVIIVEQIRRLYPHFRVKKVSPRENISKFSRNIGAREVSNVFSAVRETMHRCAAEGSVVLSSSVGLMEEADYVLVQREKSLCRERGALEREVDVAQNWRKPVYYITGFLSAVLSCTVDQL